MLVEPGISDQRSVAVSVNQFLLSELCIKWDIGWVTKLISESTNHWVSKELRIIKGFEIKYSSVRIIDF
jgi:hypothetical protein